MKRKWMWIVAGLATLGASTALAQQMSFWFNYDAVVVEAAPPCETTVISGMGYFYENYSCLFPFGADENIDFDYSVYESRLIGCRYYFNGVPYWRPECVNRVWVQFVVPYYSRHREEYVYRFREHLERRHREWFWHDGDDERIRDRWRRSDDDRERREREARERWENEHRRDRDDHHGNFGGGWGGHMGGDRRGNGNGHHPHSVPRDDDQSSTGAAR